MMRAKVAILVAVSIFSIPTIASASFNGKEDFSEPRVLAVSTSSKIDSSPWANASGYLYAPRIVFTAGHLKDNNEFSQLYVSPPNQKLRDGLQAIKVIKKYFPNTYKTRVFKDDFAIFILEKPLLNVSSASLITPELLTQAIAAKTPMKQIGFGAYEVGGARTSSAPRSIEMTPWDAAGIKSKYNQYQAEVADHLFLTAAYKGGPCGGDSGGPTTVLINGVDYYVGTVATGFWNAYACGQSGGTVGDTVGYTAPVFKFFELIAEAEKYVAEHPFVAAKATTSPKATVAAKPSAPNVSSQYQYILKLAQGWANTSRTSDTALKQCSSARDKGVIYKNGKATPIGATKTNLRRDLKRYPGFSACLAGFIK
jgi:hypothetical protein